jgi:FAD/FMN-containing dehydrogenase/Fe-S oxidoreductase
MPLYPDSYKKMEQDLRGAVSGGVFFDDGARALYATDASVYRHVPIGVVVPRNREDVIAALGVCRKYGAPVLGRGGGTSLAGQSCNAAVILDLSQHMNRVLEIDPVRKTARVEPGVVLDILNREARRHGLVFGPDPATHAQCTLGGMIGNNSCGIHSVKTGKTSDNVEELEVLTYRGSILKAGALSPEELSKIIAHGGEQGGIYKKLQTLRDAHAEAIRKGFPKLPRRISGYNLDQLLPENSFHVARALTGTEGTCAMILEATVKLAEDLPEKILAVLGYPDIIQAADDVPALLSVKPDGLEGMDGAFTENMRKKGLFPEALGMLPSGNGWLLVELAGRTQDEAASKIESLKRVLVQSRARPQLRVFQDHESREKIWRVRESAMAATLKVPGKKDTWPGWEDSAVPPEKLAPYLRELYNLMEESGYRGVIYGHFGEACVHSRIDFDYKTGKGVTQFRAFMEKAADLVLRYGGSLSGEHGDGQARAELLPKMFGPELMRAFEAFKNAWDPDGKMNPGKIIHPHRLDQDLKFGVGYPPAPAPKTHFTYPEDQGNFTLAAERCVGLGKCRKTESGTMCPSYMATRDEKHSTRGRAHLLFEMTNHRGLITGANEHHVKEALDLCLSCKACKTECPAGVDMATYKSEFLAHYYKTRTRPLAATFFGHVDTWARLGARLPGLANAVTQGAWTSRLIKKMLGVAPERPLPLLASQPFSAWHAANRKPSSGPQVLLWPDTFSNYFYPGPAIAAHRVLERLGYDVVLPPAGLCCGRPLYDYGMLDQARQKLKTTVTLLAEPLSRGLLLVGLEPSCMSVFRDELPNLFPGNAEALRLARQSLLFSEFLDREVEKERLPSLQGRALVQGHCHQKSLFGMNGERNVLQKIGMDFQILDSGCCGMAGPFGYEEKNQEVSKLCAERVMAPAVREANNETLVLADGFSCREQIRHLTDKKPMHLAELVDLAFERGQGQVF